MDKRKNNGGFRPNAGRKPKAKELELIEQLTPLEEEAFKALEKGVKEGRYNFIKLFLEYRFGKPKQMADNPDENKNVTVLNIDPLAVDKLIKGDEEF